MEDKQRETIEGLKIALEVNRKLVESNMEIAQELIRQLQPQATIEMETTQETTKVRKYFDYRRHHATYQNENTNEQRSIDNQHTSQ